MTLRDFDQKGPCFLKVHLSFLSPGHLARQGSSFGTGSLLFLLLHLPSALCPVRVSLSLFSAFPVLLVSPPTLSDPPSAFAFLAFVCRILLPCTGSLSLTCLLSLVSLLVSSPSALFSRYLVHLSPRALLPGELPDQTPPPTLPLCPAHL